MAVQFLMNNVDNDNVLECLANKYSYTLNDFYKQSGKYFNLFPKSFCNEYVNLNHELENTKKELENTKKELLDELQNNAIGKVQLNKTIKEIFSSTSWKITKPLRTLKNIFAKNTNKCI